MKKKLLMLEIMLAVLLCMMGCTTDETAHQSEQTTNQVTEIYQSESVQINNSNSSTEEISNDNQEEIEDYIEAETEFSYEDIPLYSGKAYTEIDNNIPSFSESDKQITQSFEFYSDLDTLGRCGQAYANICPEIQPTEERGTIGQIRPSGWHTVKYNDLIDGNYLYNRCHLIGYQLAGENANEKNLITGTRYLNVVGMLQFENQVDDYVQTTGNHVLYRVTPVFEGDNLVASGAQIEAWSVEDGGQGICFNVYCYNVQPGIEIDYATGESRVSPENQNIDDKNEQKNIDVESIEENTTYVINKNTKKFHLPTCSSVNDMAEHNKLMYEGTLQELINQGYSPCQRCLKGY